MASEVARSETRPAHPPCVPPIKFQGCSSHPNLQTSTYFFQQTKHGYNKISTLFTRGSRGRRQGRGTCCPSRLCEWPSSDFPGKLSPRLQPQPEGSSRSPAYSKPSAIAWAQEGGAAMHNRACNTSFCPGPLPSSVSSQQRGGRLALEYSLCCNKFLLLGIAIAWE